MGAIDLGQTIQIIANVAVLAGIVLLAIELRQNNKILAASSRATEVGLTHQVWDTIIGDPDRIAPLLLKDRSGNELTTEEEFRLNAFWLRGISNNQYSFEEQPNRFQAIGEAMRRGYAAYPSLRRTWNGNTSGSALAGKALFNRTFVDYVDSVVLSGDDD